MNTDDVIRSLIADLEPVRPMRSVGMRALAWGAGATACVVAGVALFGTRPALASKVGDGPFVAEAAVLLGVFALAARSAFRLAVPGLGVRALGRIAPIVALGAWLALVVSNHGTQASLPASGATCVWRMLVLASAPTLAMLAMLRRAAPLEREWIGVFGFLSTSALAIAGTQMICATDEPTHVVVWHCLPVVLAMGAGAMIGRAAFARNRT